MIVEIGVDDTVRPSRLEISLLVRDATLLIGEERRQRREERKANIGRMMGVLERERDGVRESENPPSDTQDDGDYSSQLDLAMCVASKHCPGDPSPRNDRSTPGYNARRTYDLPGAYSIVPKAPRCAKSKLCDCGGDAKSGPADLAGVALTRIESEVLITMTRAKRSPSD